MCFSRFDPPVAVTLRTIRGRNKSDRDKSLVARKMSVLGLAWPLSVARSHCVTHWASLAQSKSALPYPRPSHGTVGRSAVGQFWVSDTIWLLGPPYPKKSLFSKWRNLIADLSLFSLYDVGSRMNDSMLLNNYRHSLLRLKMPNGRSECWPREG